MRSLLLVLLIVFCCNLASAEEIQVPEVIRKLNLIRHTMGLENLVPDERLSVAAQAQANYLALENPLDHIQKEGSEGFYAATPQQRALRAGWPSSFVFENFSVGEADFRSSFAELMSAIYHRMIFLDSRFDRIGWGHAGTGESASYVYLLSSSLAAQACLCSEDQLNWMNPESCVEDEKIDMEHYQFAAHEQLKVSPKWVTWPHSGFDVETVFYDEVPDPLPEQSVSGYPVSIRFNPTLFKEPPHLISFELIDATGNQVPSLTVMTQESDPNQQLDPFTFIFFPKERLHRAERYTALAKVMSQHRPMEVKWEFDTQPSQGALVEIYGRGEWLRLKSGVWYSLYLPPTAGLPFFGDLDNTSGEQTEVELGWEDKNTLKFRATGAKCSRVHLDLGDERAVHILLAPPGEAGRFAQAPNCYPVSCKVKKATGYGPV